MLSADVGPPDIVPARLVPGIAAHLDGHTVDAAVEAAKVELAARLPAKEHVGILASVLLLLLTASPGPTPAAWRPSPRARCRHPPSA